MRFGGRKLTREWNRPGGGKILKITAKQAALTQGIPNFFFHAGTAFSILRAKGVPIGKGDWINNFLGLEGPGL